MSKRRLSAAGMATITVAANRWIVCFKKRTVKVGMESNEKVRDRQAPEMCGRRQQQEEETNKTRDG